MSNRNVKLIERFYFDMWNRFDKSTIPEILTENFRFRGSLGQQKVGHSELAEYVDFIERIFRISTTGSRRSSATSTDSSSN